MGVAFLTDAGGCWQLYFLRLVGSHQLLLSGGKLLILSVLALMAAIFLAGYKTSRVWQEEPPSARQAALERIFLRPVLWLSLFRRWMRHKLERNPIGWLEQRTWSGRVVTWGWLAVIISLYSAVLTDPGFLRGNNDLQPVMAWLLAGSIALSAAGSFRRERESGVLELLLVSPLGENAIISGRLRGLWSQFLPAFGTLLAVWLYLSNLLRDPGNQSEIWFFASTFLGLPVIGLYFSLRCRGFMSAALATALLGIVVPLLLPGALERLWWTYISYPGSLNLDPSGGASVIQFLIAVICWLRLHDQLKRRSFPLQRATT
jgi:ABC-type transport system involved in cytochrome c biogenesis permease component